MEHVEIEDKAPTHGLFREVIHSGLAFGAERWLSNLQRMCERIACLMVTGNSTRDLGGGEYIGINENVSQTEFSYMWKIHGESYGGSDIFWIIRQWFE